MNCVNCGAPPRHGASACAYCETALDRVVERADLSEFRTLLSIMPTTDMYKAEVVSRCDGPFTAGQTRALLREFTTDMYRLDAAEYLVPRTLNPTALLSTATLFVTDMYRQEFIELLPRIRTAAKPLRGRPAPPVHPGFDRDAILDEMEAARRNAGSSDLVVGCGLFSLVVFLAAAVVWLAYRAWWW